VDIGVAAALADNPAADRLVSSVGLVTPAARTCPADHPHQSHLLPDNHHYAFNAIASTLLTESVKYTT